jgi:putative SOS response-associated peptidase YedK
MCGRYTLSAPGDDVAALFDLDGAPLLPERYNIAPTQEAVVVRQAGLEGGRRLDFLRWGLIPLWAKEASIGNKLINARGETVAEKPAFKSSFRKKRCLVPTSGFYEWKAEGKVKQPFFIHRKDGKPFAFAGLWSSWKDRESGETIETFNLITTSPNEVLQPIHDRMPVILAPEDFQVWLDPKVEDTERLQALIKPAPPEPFEAYPVSRAVNSPMSDRADLIWRLEG